MENYSWFAAILAGQINETFGPFTATYDQDRDPNRLVVRSPKGNLELYFHYEGVTITLLPAMGHSCWYEHGWTDNGDVFKGIADTFEEFGLSRTWLNAT